MYPSGLGGEKFKTMSVSEKKLPCHRGGFSPPSYEDGDDSDSDDGNESESEDEDCEESAGVIFKFKDSLAFQKESLSNLVDRLGRAKKMLTIVQQSDLVKDSQGQFSKELFDLAQIKIAFPYEAISGLAVLEKETPPKLEDFRSTLGIGSQISSTEYDCFLKTWNLIKDTKYGGRMKMRNYLAFYNTLDTLLLSEVV